jgi:hypothetical protein
MDQSNYCCFCGEEINSSSQSCGPCMRNSNRNMYTIKESIEEEEIIIEERESIEEEEIEESESIEDEIEEGSKFTNITHYIEEEY